MERYIEEIKLLKAENEALAEEKKRSEEIIEELKAKLDDIYNQLLIYKGQVEAFRYCIKNGGL